MACQPQTIYKKNKILKIKNDSNYRVSDLSELLRSVRIFADYKMPFI